MINMCLIQYLLGSKRCLVKIAPPPHSGIGGAAQAVAHRIKIVSTVFQECFKSVARTFQKGFKTISRGFQDGFKKVIIVFQEYINYACF